MSSVSQEGINQAVLRGASFGGSEQQTPSAASPSFQITEDLISPPLHHLCCRMCRGNNLQQLIHARVTEETAAVGGHGKRWDGRHGGCVSLKQSHRRKDLGSDNRAAMWPEKAKTCDSKGSFQEKPRQAWLGVRLVAQCASCEQAVPTHGSGQGRSREACQEFWRAGTTRVGAPPMYPVQLACAQGDRMAGIALWATAWLQNGTPDPTLQLLYQSGFHTPSPSCTPQEVELKEGLQRSLGEHAIINHLAPMKISFHFTTKKERSM